MATTPMPLQGQQNYGGYTTGNQYYTVANTMTYYQLYIQNATVWGQWNQQYQQLQQPQWVEAANQIAVLGNAGLGAIRAEAAQSHEQVHEANKKARSLLFRHLSKPQQKDMEDFGHFELEVNDRLYRVRPGARVERINKKTKKVESYFCIHPSSEHRLPPHDVALSQKLLLEANEREFLSIANETKAA